MGQRSAIQVDWKTGKKGAHFKEELQSNAEKQKLIEETMRSSKAAVGYKPMPSSLKQDLLGALTVLNNKRHSAMPFACSLKNNLLASRDSVSTLKADSIQNANHSQLQSKVTSSPTKSPGTQKQALVAQILQKRVSHPTLVSGKLVAKSKYLQIIENQSKHITSQIIKRNSSNHEKAKEADRPQHKDAPADPSTGSQKKRLPHQKGSTARTSDRRHFTTANRNTSPYSNNAAVDSAPKDSSQGYTEGHKHVPGKDLSRDPQLFFAMTKGSFGTSESLINGATMLRVFSNTNQNSPREVDKAGGRRMLGSKKESLRLPPASVKAVQALG